MRVKETPEGLVDVHVFQSDQVFADLATHLGGIEPGRVLLVADENTFHACGQMVEDAIREAGLPLKKCIFPGKDWLAADETSITRVLQGLDGQEHLLAAVGSGTVTDIVRYVAYQTRLPFISIPTAASVDAYTSFTAAITLGQVKYSIPARPARTVYAHLPTLRAAPQRLTASGFSDMVAKYTALADWRLAHLIAGDSFNEVVAQHAMQAARSCSQAAEAVRAAALHGIGALVDSLMVSGRCMVTVKSSRPAAGAEHSLSHFWEIHHQLHHLPEALHGEKTGVGSVLVSGLYAALRSLSAQEAARRLGKFYLPDQQVEADRLMAALGPAAQPVLAARPSFLGWTGGRLEQIKSNLLANWGQVQVIAATVPGPQEITAWLETAGAFSRPDQINLQAEEIQAALELGMYVRDRLTILEINRMLSLV